MGHFLADRKYAGRNIVAIEQRLVYRNSNIEDLNGNVLAVTGLNAHLNLLEDFNPRRTVDDPFWWIPQGLYYDLFDNRNDNNAIPRRVALNDNVFSYTNQQFYNALDADINNLTAYRTRLLSENANRDAAGVTTIFNFYGY
jgi:hypothetical protein